MKTESTSWWSTLETLDTTLGVVLALVAIVGYGLALRNWLRFKDLTKTQARVEQRAASLLVDLDRAEKENAQLARTRDEWMPKAWLKEADKEVASGNDVRAVDVLDQGYQRMREDLGVVAHRLAEYHASRMIGFDASQEHAAAQRLSQVAAALAPGHKDIATFADDIDGIEIVDGEPLQLASSRFDAADPQEATRVIQALIAAQDRFFEKGRYQVCIVLCERATRLSRRQGLDASELGFSARFDFAQALRLGGRDRDAFEEVAALLLIRERVQGEEHPHVLAARYLKASILRRLGRYDDALAKVEALLPVYERVQGEEHPHVLTTRYLEASILHDLDRCDDALAKVEALLLVYERVQRKEHPHVLGTRNLEASILHSLGRYEEALTKVDALLPIHERVQGEEHPHVLENRRLRAEILVSLADTHDARTEINALLPLQAGQSGPDHTYTLISELILLKILAQDGRRAQARERIDGLVRRLTKATGPGHRRVRQAIEFREELGKGGQ